MAPESCRWYTVHLLHALFLVLLLLFYFLCFSFLFLRTMLFVSFKCSAWCMSFLLLWTTLTCLYCMKGVKHMNECIIIIIHVEKCWSLNVAISADFHLVHLHSQPHLWTLVDCVCCIYLVRVYYVRFSYHGLWVWADVWS